MSAAQSSTPTSGDLEFGLFDWIDVAPGVPVAEVYDGRLRLLAEADKGEFAVYHLAEHHGTPLGLAPSPGVFVAAAAGGRPASDWPRRPSSSRCTTRCA